MRDFVPVPAHVPSPPHTPDLVALPAAATGELGHIGQMGQLGELTESVLANVANLPSSPATATGVNDSGDDWAISSLCADQPLSIDDEVDEEELVSSSQLPLVMPRMMLVQSRDSPKRHIGKLKLLLAGPKGSGKSHLIDTCISECEAIKDATEMHKIGGSSVLSERKASTHSSVANSANSAKDDNIAFIDSVGWAAEEDLPDYVSSLTDYLDSLYQETASLVNGLNPASIQILTQSTSLVQFPHVDVCLYLLSGATVTTEDIMVMRAIEPYAAIIPIIGQSDSLGLLPSAIFDRKLEIAKVLRHAGITSLQLPDDPNDGLPFAVSTHMEYNYDMSASAVMAEHYRTHVLVDSDLPQLMALLFNSSGSHSARLHTAQKFVEWVSSMHLSSTLNHRLHAPLAQTPLAPRKLVLNLSEANSDRNISKEWYMTASPTMVNSTTEPIELAEPADLVVTKTDRPRRSSFNSIENLDPLDLTGWSRAIKVLAALAAAAAAATLGTLGWKWFSLSSPPPPPPKTIRGQDFLEHWGALLRITLAG